MTNKDIMTPNGLKKQEALERYREFFNRCLKNGDYKAGKRALKLDKEYLPKELYQEFAGKFGIEKSDLVRKL